MAWPVFRGLFDDASLFPPASLAMADAVAGHLRHQAAWYREMSGPLVCADTKITELSAALTAAGSEAGGNSDASSNSPPNNGHAMETPPAPADG